MRTGTLVRIREESGDQGTFGKLTVGMLELYTGELPWREDKKDLSCLPPADAATQPCTYRLSYIWSQAHGKKNYRFVALKLSDGSWGTIPDNRTAAEAHAANVMGDILKGFAAQLEGCVALGRAIVTFHQGDAFRSFTADSPETLVPVLLSQDQKGVSSSVDAVDAFEKELMGEDLELTISWS